MCNIEGLGLETVGVKTERGAIVIDAYGGDQRGRHLGHRRRRPGRRCWRTKAEHEAVITVEKIAGLKVSRRSKS